jgi:hypothetical protein
MTPVQRIEVDTKLEFKLPELLDIEIYGPDKISTRSHSHYTRSVARNVVTKTNNKSTADLIECRSQDFMREMGKSAPVNFFSRFNMHLYEEINTDVEADFTCKWYIIEQSLYKAMSKEQNTLRLANFYDKDYEQFHSKPLELLINEVDIFVDTTLGKSLTLHTDTKGRVLSNTFIQLEQSTG